MPAAIGRTMTTQCARSYRGVTSGAPTKEGIMDALRLLKEDHEKVKKLLSDIESTTERAVKTRTSELARLKQELTIHEAIEEEIFYPALKEHAKTREIALEAYEEHGVVDMIMAEIEQTPVEDETWIAKFTVMKENLEHHIEEEEGEMFKQARQVFDKETLEDLGERMQARKQSGRAA
jgi:hemerythrin-like domain-containing protein